MGDTTGKLNERGVAKINLMNILHVDENYWILKIIETAAIVLWLIKVNEILIVSIGLFFTDTFTEYFKLLCTF